MDHVPVAVFTLPVAPDLLSYQCKRKNVVATCKANGKVPFSVYSRYLGLKVHLRQRHFIVIANVDKCPSVIF